MFSLHETQRKRWCRIGFFALCVAPTVATMAFVAAKRWPGRDGRWSRAAAAELLTPLAITGASEPRPGVIECAAVTILDRVELEPVAELAALTAQLRGGRQAIRIERIDLAVERLPALALLVEQWLADDSLQGDVLINQLVLTRGCAACAVQQPEGHALGEAGPRGGPVGGGACWTLHDVRVRVQRDGEVRMLSAQGLAHQEQGDDGSHSAEEADAPRAQIAVESRPRTIDQRRMLTVGINAAECALPSWIVDAFAVSESASLNGQLQFVLRSGVLQETSFQGTVRQFNAASLLPPDSPHEIHCVADLTQVDLHWSEREGTTVAGELRASDVQVSPSLARAAIKPLWCVPTEWAWKELAEGRGELIRLANLACRFTWSAQQQLTIDGLCGDGPQPDKMSVAVMHGEKEVPTALAVLATREGRPWLLEPQYEQIPAAMWREFLSPRTPAPAAAAPAP